ncbi:hypothetical protein Q9L58_001886 [Maublancomyces gigas]|uniref:Uncharacterized protein n=1 Tax=Discina gigas TaxID=1032678 RepID=A0ABR3GST7_9PEZI
MRVLIDRMQHFPHKSRMHRPFDASMYGTHLRLLEIMRDLIKQVDEIREQNFALHDVLSTVQRVAIETLMEVVDFERMQFAYMENLMKLEIQEYENRV